MANNQNNSSKNQLWVKITCGVLGFLMMGAVVFMLVQILMA